MSDPTSRGARLAAGPDYLQKKLSLSKTIEKSKNRQKPPISPLPKTKGTPKSTNIVVDLEADEEPSTRKTYEHPTGNKLRDKVRENLAKALTSDGEGVVAAKEDALQTACAIEVKMWKKFGSTNDDYKAKFRTLNFNFKDKKNGNLRSAILKGNISPKHVVNMTSEELANDDLKKYRQEVKEHMMYEAQPEEAQTKREATTDMWRCGKCKNRKCTYYQLQTRSADEPMTTFITCTVCGNRWRQAN